MKITVSTTVDGMTSTPSGTVGPLPRAPMMTGVSG
jgi:hypothetical protein